MDKGKQMGQGCWVGISHLRAHRAWFCSSASKWVMQSLLGSPGFRVPSDGVGSENSQRSSFPTAQGWNRRDSSL